MSSLFIGSIIAYNVFTYLKRNNIENDKRTIVASEIYINMKIITAYKKDDVQIGATIEDSYGNMILSTGICDSVDKYKVTYVTTLYDSIGKIADIIYNPYTGDIKQFILNNVTIDSDECNSIVSCLYLDPKCTQLQIMYDENCPLCKYIMNNGKIENITAELSICTMTI